jgi:hypothetical protein
MATCCPLTTNQGIDRDRNLKDTDPSVRSAESTLSLDLPDDSGKRRTIHGERAWSELTPSERSQRVIAQERRESAELYAVLLQKQLLKEHERGQDLDLVPCVIL